MNIITVSVIKGGAGKTATAAALAQAGARDGKRILAIDLDPQGNLTQALAADLSAGGAVQLFRGEPAADVIQQTEQGIYCISAHRDLSNERTTPGSANRLRQALDPIKGKFDICIIDTPPTMGELTYNALNAAEWLLIPLETDTYSLQGLYHITEIAKLIQQANTELKILGTVLTRFDPRPNLNKHIYQMISEEGERLGAPLLKAIRGGIAVREAAALQVSLFDHAGRGKPAADYLELYGIIQQIINQEH